MTMPTDYRKRVIEVLRSLSRLDHEALTTFGQRYGRSTRTDAADLLGGRFRRYTDVVGCLSGYAWNRVARIKCLRNGDIRGARVYAGLAKTCAQRALRLTTFEN